MADKFLNPAGLTRTWERIKAYVDGQITELSDDILEIPILSIPSSRPYLASDIWNGTMDSGSTLVVVQGGGVTITNCPSGDITTNLFKIQKAGNLGAIYCLDKPGIFMAFNKPPDNSQSFTCSGLFDSNLPLATDNYKGAILTNNSDGITTDETGALVVKGRLGAFSGTTGIFHSNDRQPRQVSDFSFLITDAKGMNLAASRDLAIVTGVNLTLTNSHAAGSTTYTVANNYANRIACAVLANGGYLSQSEAYSKENQIVEVTSVTIDGAAYTPNSSASDKTKPITITVATSANPTAAVTALRVFGGITGGYCSEYIGQCVGGAMGASLLIGQRVICKSGNVNAIVAADTYNAGNGNALFGRLHISTKNRWLMAGSGHDNTNGRSEAGAVVGQYSLIDANTLFAVGNGTDNVARSNAFEVTNDGAIVLKSPNGTRYKISVADDGTISSVSA